MTDAGAGTSPRPQLPPGHPLALARGTTFVREIEGPPGAPVVVLLHGWTVTADLNFWGVYEPLGEHYRVIAADHHGHGRGVRTEAPFTLEGAADDAAEVVRALGAERVIAVGYSMGGAVAQLLWRRHPELVDGLVLCSTAPTFNDSREEAMRFVRLGGITGLVRAAPDGARRWLADQYVARKGRDYDAWALEEIARHDVTAQLEAGVAIGRFSSLGWLGEIDVPTSVVVTTTDQVVPPRRQVKLFERIHGAEAYRVDGAHDAISSQRHDYVPVLLAALGSVAGRIDARARNLVGGSQG